MIMNRSWICTILSALVGLTAMTMEGSARADVVDNPGYFEFQVMPGTDSHFRFTSGSGKFIQLAPSLGYYFNADIDSIGVVSNVDSNLAVGTFNNIGGGTSATAELMLLSSSEGFVDPVHNVLAFRTTKARVRFQIGLSACTTGTFTIDLSTENYAGSECNGVNYDPSTGVFCMSASNFVVPQLASTACSNNGNLLNSYFNLGVSTGSYMQILSGVVDPAIVGS
jgi:hypothetical protein